MNPLQEMREYFGVDDLSLVSTLLAKIYLTTKCEFLRNVPTMSDIKDYYEDHFLSDKFIELAGLPMKRVVNATHWLIPNATDTWGVDMKTETIHFASNHDMVMFRLMLTD